MIGKELGVRMKELLLACALIVAAAPFVSSASANDLRPRARPEVLNVTPVSLSSQRPEARPSAAQPGARRVAARVPQGATISSERRAFAIDQAKAKRDRGQRVWCVPFARDISGVELRGNAHTWWGQAAGRYARTKNPQIGAVMNFQATKRMPMGHVAVVSQIVNNRRILIDHANWTRNRVSLNMAVIDVSEKNDWSRVRLEDSAQRLGSVYPVYGFILASAQ